MTQTSKIAGSLMIAWIVFITVRGELPAYLAILGIVPCGVTSPSGCKVDCGGSSTSTQPPASTSTQTSTSTSTTSPPQ